MPAIGVWLLAAGQAVAQNQYLQTREVLIFPGNVAFFAKEGNLVFRNRKAVIAEVPKPLYGTYWLRPGGPFSILRTEFGIDTVYDRREATSFFEVLKANVGAIALVTYQVGQEIEDVRGEILPFMQGSSLVRIRQTTGGTMFLQDAMVRQVAVEGNANTHYWEPRLGEATIVEIDKPLSSAPIQLFYYTEGLSWEPAYNLRLISDSTLQLIMKATLENRVESFQHANVRFVLGAPNLRYGSRLSQNTTDLLEYLQQPVSAQQAQAVYADEAPNPTTPPRDSSAAVQAALPKGSEFVVYKLGQLSVTKGTKSIVTVLQDTVGAQLIHKALLPLRVDSLTAEPRPIENLLHTATLALRFHNTTGYPLLPGTALLMDRAEHPLGQQDLPAMRPNDQADLLFASAPEIQLYATETVFERAPRARRDNQGYWDQVTVRGIVRLQNRTDYAREVEVAQGVMGELRRTSNARVHDTARSIAGQPVRTLNWRTPVAAQSVQVLHYEYVYYVPER